MLVYNSTMIEIMIIEMKLIHERAINHSIITLSFYFYLYACTQNDYLHSCEY